MVPPSPFDQLLARSFPAVPAVVCSAASADGDAGNDEPSPDVASTRRRRGEPLMSDASGTLKQQAVASNNEVSDKLIAVFQEKQLSEWRKLIAYSKQWPMLAPGLMARWMGLHALPQHCCASLSPLPVSVAVSAAQNFNRTLRAWRRVEERAAAAEEASEEQLALRKLGRRLAAVNEELSLYQQVIDKFRCAYVCFDVKCEGKLLCVLRWAGSGGSWELLRCLAPTCVSEELGPPLGC